MANLSDMSSSSARQAKLRALQEAVRGQQDACDKLATELRHCDFVYSPPQPDFDSRRVIGTIISLIDWCDPQYCTAVEVAAGERLYSVVVDTDETCMLLMQRGKLQSRTIFILLDQINGQVIDRKTVEIAQRIGGGPENVQLALDLVSFDSHYRPAMNWVFGSTLVCKDFETAEKVALNPDVMCCGVTLDGEVVEANGAMTGGPKLKGPSILATKQAYKKMEQDLKTAKAELSLYTAELQEAGDK